MIAVLFFGCDDGGENREFDHPCDPLNDGDVAVTCGGDAGPDMAPPQPLDICDGEDNDGDGQVDEQASFQTGYGEYCRTDLRGAICDLGRLWCEGGALTCAPIEEPVQEGPLHRGTCGNGIDEDCDGRTDEGSVFNDRVCDGIDADCDGMVDEGDVQDFENFDEEEMACNTGLTGACGEGTWVCTRGGFYCKSNSHLGDLLQQQAEDRGGDSIDRVVEGHQGLSIDACDGIDEDCDGEMDEDSFLEIGFECDLAEGVPNPCGGPGHLACNGRLGLDCVPVMPPEELQFNLFDDDCDGEIDEGPEACNGIDDDRDGEIDEHIEEVGQRCDIEVKGETCAGERVCMPDGMLGCTPMLGEDGKPVCS